MATIYNELPEKLSHNHPLFLHSIDNSCVLLSSIQLTGADNFSVWSRAMKIAIIGRNKLGFIDGSCRKEFYGPNLTNLWERCNAIVLSWIMKLCFKGIAWRHCLVHQCSCCVEGFVWKIWQDWWITYLSITQRNCYYQSRYKFNLKLFF